MAIVVGAFGLLIGSFLNVVIYRVPLGRSIISPASACGNCGHPVRTRDNIPVLSWLVLLGRCRDCDSPISLRYPLVEAGAALFFVLVAARFVPSISGTTASTVGGVLALIGFLYLAAISLALALIDLDVHRLPNVIVLPAYLVGAVLLGASSLLTNDPGSLASAAIGCVALGLLYLGLALAYPGGMGFGDVKLAGALGLFLGWLGWAPLIVGTILAFLLGGLFGVLLLLFRKTGRKTAIPFGPWMLLGAWIGILAGVPIAAGYLSLFALA